MAGDDNQERKQASKLAIIIEPSNHLTYLDFGWD
jgi:hypothetical protein